MVLVLVSSSWDESPANSPRLERAGSTTATLIFANSQNRVPSIRQVATIATLWIECGDIKP